MSVSPIHYKLLIAPNIAADTFYGELELTLRLVESVSEIHLNLLSLSLLEGGSLTIGDRVWPVASFSLNHDAETVALEFSTIVPPCERAVLRLRWNGQLKAELHGLYKTTYRDKDGKRCDTISTHFEPTNARRCFPCLDQPGYKATFAISVIINDHLHVISNQPAKETTLLPNSMQKWTFETTPLMSTYLVAITAGQWDVVRSQSKSGVIVQSWAPLGCAKAVEQSNAWATAILDFYSDFFSSPYPLPKLDIVPVESFPLGGMENWGCITAKPSLVMLTPDSSTEDLLYMKEIVAHEVAHMWFGNLVTPFVWNSLWLKEGFATMLSFLAANKLEPYGGWSERFLYSYSLVAREMDSLSVARALESSVTNSGEANEQFDEIGYAKGASIIAMLAAYCGFDALQSGLSSYIDKFEYGNATASDLWTSLNTDMMDSWITQPGYPLITVERRGPTSIFISQKRFGVDDGAIWVVPLLYITNLDTQRPQKVLLRSESMTLQIDPAVDFVYFNSSQKSEVVVHYLGELHSRLIANFNQRSDCNKMGFLSDLLMLFKIQVISLPELIGAFESLKSQMESPPVLHTCAELLGWCLNLFEDNVQTFQAFATLADTLFAEKLSAWGFKPLESADENVRLARGSIIRSLGFAKKPEIFSHAKEIMARLLPLDVSADLRECVWTAAVVAGDDYSIEMLDALILDPSVPDSSKALALAILFKRLEGPLNYEKRFNWFLGSKPQVKGTLLKNLLNGLHEASDENRMSVWSYIEQHWTLLITTAGGFGSSARAFIQAFIHSGNSNLANRIEAFVAALPDQQKSFVANTSRRVVEIIHRNHRLKIAVQK